MLDRIVQFLAHDLTKEQVTGVVKTGWRALILVHIAYACGALSMFGLPGFARASDDESLKQQVARLSDQIEKSEAVGKVAKLELELQGIDEQIFTIEARLAEIGRLGQVADSLYIQRLTELRTQHNKVERELAVALRHPALKLAPNG